MRTLIQEQVLQAVKKANELNDWDAVNIRQIAAVIHPAISDELITEALEFLQYNENIDHISEPSLPTDCKLWFFVTEEA